VAGDHNATGKTAGEALDAIAAQIGGNEMGALLVFTGPNPDRFFDSQQQSRLRELMDRWRTHRDRGETLDPVDQTELNALVETELKATVNRANEIADAFRQ
jgi:hypothetical protein